MMWSTHGQMDGLLALGSASFLALVGTHPVLAGAALALLSVKPHLGIFPAVLVIMWAVRRRRWGVLAGLGLGVGGLAIASFAVQPLWLGEWVGALLHPPEEIVQGRAQYAPTVYYFARLLLPLEAASLIGVVGDLTAGCAILL